MSFAASDIADPYQRLEARARKIRLYDARARFDKADITYRAAGDYHRVDRTNQDTTFDLSIDLADDFEVFGSTSRAARDGFWLTNRIGNQNITPLTTIPGVASPRAYDSDHSEIGVTTRIAGASVTIAVDYRGDRDRNRWIYSRPATLNPAFPESEDFTSSSTLRGPGTRWMVSRRVGVVDLEVSGRFVDLERRTRASGVSAASTSATSPPPRQPKPRAGPRPGWSTPARRSTWRTRRRCLPTCVGSTIASNSTFCRTDTTIYPNLATSTTVVTNQRQRTTQRKLEGSLQLDVEPFEGLLLSGGYVFSRENLAVPDLESGDNDFVRGLVRDDGGIAGIEWRPDSHWVLGADYRHVGQDGAELHELVAQDARFAKGRVRFQGDDFWIEVFAADRQRENDVSGSRYESLSTGVTASLQRGEHLDLYSSWVFSDIDSRTLTNFYFDPDPNPQPTIVGFDGTTHTVTAGLGFRPDEVVRWRFDGVYTETDGSFEVRLFDWRGDVSVEVFPGGEAGVQFRHVDYDEAGSLDDYDAVITMVYWRQRIGGGD